MDVPEPAETFELGLDTCGTLPHEKLLASIELFGRQVVARVRGLLAGVHA